MDKLYHVSIPVTRSLTSGISHGIYAGRAESYIYDPNGFRVEKVGSKGKIHYVPLLNGEVGYRKEFAANKEYSFIYVGGQHLARVNGVVGSSGKKFYYHNGHLCSALAVTDENGNKVVNRDFTPFGERINTDVYDDEPRDPDEDESGFTGKDWDIDAELYYYNARWYDPAVGRFISEDSVADDPNLYGYCGQNPVNFTDPTGHVAEGTFKVGFQQGWGLAGAMLNAAALLSGDENLSTLSSVFSLFVAVKYYKARQAEKAAAAAKENEPISDPVTKPAEVPADTSGSGSGENTNAGNSVDSQPPPEDNASSDENTQTTINRHQLTTETLLYAPLSELIYLSTEASLVEVIEAEIKFRNLVLRLKYGETFILPTKFTVLTNVYGKRVAVMCEDGQYSTSDHEGWDLANVINTKVVASASGIITAKVPKELGGRAGNHIIIDHGNGLFTLYGHLNSFAGYNEGDFVGQGWTIGYMGKTGSASGVHLHFGIAKGKRNYVNPANYITLPAGLTTAWDVKYNSKTGQYYNYLPPQPTQSKKTSKKKGWWPW